MTFLSPAAPEVVILTTSIAACVENFVNKPSSGPVMANFTDVYIHHSALMS